ncbi:MAG: hypothetical protein SFV21_06160 [Rhodospirillaceae bacterium]|nr:hypothetical protein [Rhodospirillaceae bacterium]
MKVDKRLEAMRLNPRADWTLADLQTVAARYRVVWRHGGGSHAVFRSPTGMQLVVPARRPIKPVYVSRFVELIDDAKEAQFPSG